MLRAWRAGEAGAFERLAELSYPKLRQMADGFLRREASGHTLQPTALVHEIYLLLMNRRQLDWKDREHFYAFSAQLMRMTLRDWARDKRAQKRGGGVVRIPASDELPWAPASGDSLLDLERALDELERLSPRKVRLLELRVYLGCSLEEAAELTGLSRATAARELRVARAWLVSRLSPGATAPSPADDG